MITIELLRALCPKTKVSVLEKYVEPLNEVCEYYEINTNQRVAGFLAQVAHESGDFNFTKENLNYSTKGLMTTFKKYFPTEESTNGYSKNPTKIANKVYANRMGNGAESTGDGAMFCGRGLIQLTGKQNYSRFAADLEMSIEDCVKYMETPEGAVSSAGWFWDNNDLNKYCDNDDFTMLTKRINGGVLGLADRLEKYHHMLDILSQS
jgi:putative chitinase